MIEIKEKEKCCGCSACESICPKKSISMIADEEGFLYPKVNLNTCIDCSLCEKVCPMEKSIQTSISEAYIGRTTNSNIINTSSSGGVITSIVETVLKNDWIVYGAIYNKEFNVIHKDIGKIEDISKLSGSKYVQSNLAETYIKCKEDLSKRNVLFIGTPCQVAGLKNYLIKEYSNLFTIEFVCHGVASPAVWNSYKQYQEKIHNSKISNVNFRSKFIGYRSTGILIEFENDKKYFASPRTDFMLKAFYNDLIGRDSCYNCPFKGNNRFSDLVVFDCWNPSSIVSSIKDDNMGYSKCLVFTNKGKELLMFSKENLILYKTKSEDIIPTRYGNAYAYSMKKPIHKNDYWEHYKRNTYGKSQKEILKISNRDVILEKSKYILNKMRILSLITKNK